MKELGISPSILTFNELLAGYAREDLFQDGFVLLKEMDETDVEPTSFTLAAAEKLINSARSTSLRHSPIQSIFTKMHPRFTDIGDYPSELPLLAALLVQAEHADPEIYLHVVEAKGARQGLQGLSSTLLADIFAGKMQGRFFSTDLKQLSPQSDRKQDRASQERFAAMLRCVSREGLHLPSHLEGLVMEFIGSHLYSLQVSFESDTCSALAFQELSCQYPRLGFRHCWVKPGSFCGQRTYVNGHEDDEACFNRHIGAVGIR